MTRAPATTRTDTPTSGATAGLDRRAPLVHTSGQLAGFRNGAMMWQPKSVWLGGMLASFGAASGCATAEDLGPAALGDLGFLDGGFGGPTGDGSVTPGAGGAFPGAGGFAATGGSRASGGGSASGGARSGAGGGAATGGRSSTGGATASGGATAGGGSSATGGASSGGTSGNTGGAGCADSDGDGATDCAEDGDGDGWTDRAVFNGLHVSRGNQCSSVGNCRENDTFAEVQSCMQGNVDEEKDQYAGWDWQNPPDNINSSGYGFQPNWSGSDTSWAALWEGCIHFATDGPHCFQIEGGTSEGCAAFYFDGNTGDADFQTGTGPTCFTVPAGNYPIVFHYTMDNGSSSSMHVQYCDAGGAASCTPSAAIPAAMLRTACP